MDAGVCDGALRNRPGPSDSQRFQLDTGGGKRNIREGTQITPQTYAPNPETPHRCRAHETLLIQLRSENMMI